MKWNESENIEEDESDEIISVDTSMIASKVERIQDNVEEILKEMDEILKKTKMKEVERLGDKQAVESRLTEIQECVKDICDEYKKNLKNALKNTKKEIRERDDKIDELEDEIERLKEEPEGLKEEIKDLEEQLNSRMKQIQQIIKEYTDYEEEKYSKMKEKPEKHGSMLKVNDFTILKFLFDNGGKAKFNEIVEGTGMNPKTVNERRKSLLLLGFVKKSEDGSYQITENGEQAIRHFEGKI